MISVGQQFPQFFGTDGLALDGAQIWIGAANTNPETNQIDVFFDIGLTIPAGQPLTTSGGFVVNGSGAAQNIYIDANNCSMTVRTAAGVLVSTTPVYTPRFASESFTFGTITVNDGILPDAAGGASIGTNALAFSDIVAQAMRTKALTLYSTTQPAAPGDMNKLTQRSMPLCIVEQTATGGTAAWVNGLNVNTAGSSRLGAGSYEVAFTVPLPAQYFPVATVVDPGTLDVGIHVDNRTANRMLVKTTVAGVATNLPFVVVVLGNPAIADPIVV